MSDPIRLTLHNYRGFMQQFRAAMGVGASVRSSAAPPPATVDVATVGGVYRYQRSDLYLTHGKPAGGGAFQQLEVNYARMDPKSDLSQASIDSALYAAPANERTRPIIIAITSEAARSQVVYQVIQRLLYSKEKHLAWGELVPLFRVWGHYTVSQEDKGGRRGSYHHKSKPPTFGPLGVRDYYDDPGATAVMNELRQAGFALE